MADLFLRIVGEDNTSSAFKDASTGVRKLAAELYRFGLDSVKQSEDQARADRLLESVAGELTDTFKAQAAAMQSTLGVSDDMVQGIQTMLLRFEEAPASVEATTRALLDYAAATGTDAIAATKMLTSAAQSGRAAFKELGLEYESTGVASKDLENITAALATKVGGAAAAEADSLTGSVNKAKQAFGELQEAIGQALTVMAGDAKGGSSWLVNTLDRLASNIRFLAGTTPETAASKLVILKESAASAFEALQEERVQLNKLYEMDAPVDAITRQMDFVKALEVAFLKAKKAREEFEAGGPKLSTEGSDRPTKAGAAAGDKPEESGQKVIEVARTQFAQQVEDAAEHVLDMKKLQERELADRQRFDEQLAMQLEQGTQSKEKASAAEFKRLQAQKDRQDSATLRQAEAAQKKLDDSLAKSNKEFGENMAAAGAAIGTLFANQLADAIGEAAAGGEVDVGQIVLDLGFGVAAIIANIALPGSGALVGAIGQLASAGYRATKPRKSGAKRHEGGWPDDYHAGGWPGLGTDEQSIVTQSGERVWSRQEVARAGGRGAVDAMARGGGGRTMNVTIVAQDSESLREAFEDRSGRAMLNAVRTGHGPLAQLLSGRR